MKQDLEARVSEIVGELYQQPLRVSLTRPDESFGDYTTNVAMQLAAPLKESPRFIADQIVSALVEKHSDIIAKATVQGPGFINVTLHDRTLTELFQSAPHHVAKKYHNQSVVVEYSDPNPFKVLHAGHLYTSVVGDAIANLLEFAGGTVHRVNFGGDVGLHVAKTIWAILMYTTDERIQEQQKALKEVQILAEKPLLERASWLADRYVEGNVAYESENSAVQSAIQNLNVQIYDITDKSDHSTDLAKLYWLTRQWSYDYFDEFYQSIGSHFDKYYPESQTASIGLKKAKELVSQGILVESNGAVVFPGEAHNLHTRVFINSQGLPTYESKDLGLQLAKWDDYHFDRSIIITGNDIIEYMKVVIKVVEQFDPKLAKATTHLTHGIVKLVGGQKMSSRKGNILRAVEVLEAASSANKKLTGKENRDTSLGAVKYSFLKQHMGGDILYDPAQSVSIEGNSGPYLQYAHARARSILAKAPKVSKVAITTLEPLERTLASKISEYPEVLDRSIDELMPHHLANYLYEVAQVFNRFYEQNKVIGDDRQGLRIGLVQAYADILQSGLSLLNIAAPMHI